MRHRSPVLLPLLALAVGLARAADAPGHATVTAERWAKAQGAPDLTWVEWKMHSGDDPQWAKPEADDRTWPTVAPLMIERDLPAGRWTGQGWLRLHLAVDDSLVQRTLALCLRHPGASEIFFDGQPVGGFGRIGLRPGDERVLNPHGTPVALSLAGRRDHVIAVRYSNWAHQQLHARYPWWDRDHQQYQGFFATLAELGPALEARKRDTLDVLLFGAVTTLVPGLVSLLLIIRFRRNRSDRSSRWFALCTGSMALAALHTPLFVFLPKETETLIWQDLILPALSYVATLSGLAALYAEFDPNAAGRMRWFVLASVGGFLAVFAGWGQTVWLVILAATALEAGRVLRHGHRARHPGVQILAAGAVVVVATVFAVAVSIGVFQLTPNIRVAQAVVLVGLPLAIALFAQRAPPARPT